MSTKKPVWSWTDAVAKADVPPLTKLVCLNIARYFSSAGKGWRVSIKEMMADTGLSNRSLATHLQLAADAKLLIVKREAGPHGQRGVTTYIPCFPDGTELAREAELPPREGDSLGLSEPSSPGPSEPASPRPREPRSRQVSFRKTDSSQREGARAMFFLPMDWSLPDAWRSWALKEAPEYSHQIESDAKKFRAHWRGKQRSASEAEWEGAWQKWWLSTIERPPSAAKGGSFKVSAGRTVRDTSIPFAEEMRQAIEQGTYKP